MKDSNLRSPAPKAGGLNQTFLISEYGGQGRIRTYLTEVTDLQSAATLQLSRLPILSHTLPLCVAATVQVAVKSV